MVRRAALEKHRNRYHKNILDRQITGIPQTPAFRKAKYNSSQVTAYRQAQTGVLSSHAFQQRARSTA